MFNHIADAIKTPHIIKLSSNLYVARFESMKIYSTLYAVESLLKKGIINNETTLIDCSSGTYAYALALACHKYSLKCHIIASSLVDSSLKLQLELLGAVVESMPSVGIVKLDQKYRVEKVNNVMRENSNYYWMKQYHDNIHYGGYEEFADLVIKELECQKLTVVGGIGSGCSTGALGTFLRKKGVSVNLCGIEPFGSVTFGAQKVEDLGFTTAGIGSGIEFLNVKYDSYDSINWLSFDIFLSGTIELMKKHAVFAGLSSGGCYCVGKREARLQPEVPCLFIAADTGHRYVQQAYTRYQECHAIDSLEPKIVTKSSELALPWSQYQWNRKDKSELLDFCN